VFGCHRRATMFGHAPRPKPQTTARQIDGKDRAGRTTCHCPIERSAEYGIGHSRLLRRCTRWKSEQQRKQEDGDPKQWCAKHGLPGLQRAMPQSYHARPYEM